jgi:hypothetical protein
VDHARRTVDGHPVTIAILDHPGNPGSRPIGTRGYGLFAANPLGQAVQRRQGKLNFT